MQRPSSKVSAQLLIVDDREEVLRALERFMALYFERVQVASTPELVEARLRADAPRFLLCDYWLGEQHPPSTELIPVWRRRYPTIERVALMTGTKSSSIPPCAAVDGIFQKPLDMQQVVEFFAG